MHRKFLRLDIFKYVALLSIVFLQIAVQLLYLITNYCYMCVIISSVATLGLVLYYQRLSNNQSHKILELKKAGKAKSDTIQENEAILQKALLKLNEKEQKDSLQKIHLEDYHAKILAQNEELMQTQKELMTQREFMEKQQAELEQRNKIIRSNESILMKGVEKLKKKEAEVLLQKAELEEKNAEILTQNEELMQTQEELMAQREFMEKQQTELEQRNKIIRTNESILMKAVDKLKKKEAEILLQKAELEEKNAEILTQNEELMQTQEELLTQREFIEKQHKDLQYQSSKIKNSIQSALLIQQAILPYPEKMKELLDHYFVIYRPRDVVSGDFWWLNEINGKIYFACVDCTGHGVAGAFMTMIGNTLLDKIIRLRAIESPAEILEILHNEVQIVLRQKETHNNNGMDMSLICIDKTEDCVRLIYAGAKQSMYFVPLKDETILEIKGERKAIGGEQSIEKQFINHSISLEKGSWIYMGSDGLYDQNNGKRKKFGEKLLKNILLENHHFSAYQQQALLEKALDEHQGETEQRDDILWIGIRL